MMTDFTFNTPSGIIGIYFSLIGGAQLVFWCFFCLFQLFKSIKNRVIKPVLFVIGINYFLFCNLFSLRFFLYLSCATLLILCVFNWFYLLNHLTQSIKKKLPWTPPSLPQLPTVSVLVAARDESNVIHKTLEKINELHYPKNKLKVFVVDDHSEDHTLEVLRQQKMNFEYTILSNHRPNGKANALNYALKFIDTDYVVLLDADHLIPKNYVLKALKHFKNEKIAFVQGRNVVRNGGKSLLARLVEVDYYAMFSVIYHAKMMSMFLGTGAMFKTEALKQVDGFNTEVATEDIELACRLHAAGYHAIHDVEIATYELATTDVKNFIRQRNRWMRGIWQTLLLHIKLVFQAKSLSLHKKVDFFYIPLGFLALLSHFATHVLFFCQVFGWPLMQNQISVFSFIVILYVTEILVKSRALSKVGKLHLLPYILLLPVYFGLYSIAAVTAFFDELIVKKEVNFKAMKVSR